MAGFVDDLTLINARADAAPGFVWRLVGDGLDNATSLRLFDSDLMVNMSVWESVETLRDFFVPGRRPPGVAAPAAGVVLA